MKKIITLIILLSLLALTGCATKQPTSSYSGIDSSKYKQAQQVLVDNVIETLSKRYPAGYTSFNVLHGQKNSAFGIALENSLRHKGFVVGEADKTIIYVVDSLNDNQLYVSIKITDGFAFTCFYAFANDAVVSQGQAHHEAGND